MAVIWQRGVIAPLKYLMFKPAGRSGAQFITFLTHYLNFFAVLFPMNQRPNLPTSISGVCGLVPTANSLRQEQKTIKLEFVLFSFFLMAVVYIY
jgi:hypothetical protein